MFTDLPEFLKNEVLFYLESNNFPMAKALYDKWKEKPNQSQVTEHSNESTNGTLSTDVHGHLTF
jgi:hypothetical protein